MKIIKQIKTEKGKRYHNRNIQFYTFMNSKATLHWQKI